MESQSFRKQIEEDIAFYQERHPFVPNIQKPEWAFNFWVLDKLYGEDEDVIESEITDYSDHGIDCFVWHEDSKDLYLIQNKFFSDGNVFSKTYFNDAVQDAYGQLLAGTYTRSPELQKIFSKYHDHSDFYVYHYFYVTNNDRSASVDAAVKDFNERFRNTFRTAAVYYLDDIHELFFGEPIREKPHFTAQLRTINSHTALNVNTMDYGLNFDIDAKYIMLPVTELYQMLEKADGEHYPIFDANIREYLGTTRAVNKRIIETLQSDTERNRFFFYNNGITIICTAITSQTIPSGSRFGVRFTMRDPQIVNGCQTVSSIQHVLSNYPAAKVDKDFADSFVMAKVLVIPETDDPAVKVSRKELRESIVRYNNSQNSIDEKNFTMNQKMFKRIQEDFAQYGFLVMLRQSDKVQFTQEYKYAVSKLLAKADSKLKQFGLDGKVKTVRDFLVPLDKLLQAILAFSGDAQQAFQKKAALLNTGSSQYALVTDAILNNPSLTTHTMLDLYLLYLRSEKEKSENTNDGKIPITWYLIEGFSRFECNSDYAEVSKQLQTRQQVDHVIRLYMVATQLYLQNYMQIHPTGGGYNAMIKEKIDLQAFGGHRLAAMSIPGI